MRVRYIQAVYVVPVPGTYGSWLDTAVHADSAQSPQKRLLSSEVERYLTLLLHTAVQQYTTPINSNKMRKKNGTGWIYRNAEIYKKTNTSK